MTYEGKPGETPINRGFRRGSGTPVAAYGSRQLSQTRSTPCVNRSNPPQYKLTTLVAASNTATATSRTEARRTVIPARLVRVRISKARVGRWADSAADKPRMGGMCRCRAPASKTSFRRLAAPFERVRRKNRVNPTSYVLTVVAHYVCP